MKTKSLILILIALGCGSVAAVGATQVLESRKGGPDIETVQILIAATDLSIGDRFEQSNVKLEEWPKDRVPQNVVKKFEAVEGKFARQRLYEGEPILAGKVKDTLNQTSGQIPKGYRVISVKVQVDTAVAGLLKPGDKIDLIVFLRKGPEVPTTGTHRFLQNVTVFAVNAKTEQSVDEEGKSIQAKTVSVLVTPTQAQKVALVSRLGSMHLTLRRPDEQEESGLQNEKVTIQSLLSGKEDASSDTFVPPPAAAPDPVYPAMQNTTAWGMELITPTSRQGYHFSDVTGPPDELHQAPPALPVSQESPVGQAGGQAAGEETAAEESGENEDNTGEASPK